MTCIYCDKSASGSSVSHIFPASLGGEEWACLPDGLVCSQCNQYFGEKVESRALQSFPFLPFRVFLGIPTKKGKPPKMSTYLGLIEGDGHAGHVGITPHNAALEAGINEGAITQMRIAAEPTEPEAICRMLVKMGLEVVAADSPSDARSPKFDSARNFARHPKKGSQWWFLVMTDHAKLFTKFRGGLSMHDWINGVSLSVSKFPEFEAFRLQLLDMIILTPLDGRVQPPVMDELPEPEYQLFQVTIGHG